MLKGPSVLPTFRRQRGRPARGPPPGHLAATPGDRWLPGRALPIATRRDRTWPGLGCGGVELGGQGHAKSQLPIPGSTAGALLRPPRWVWAKDFAWFVFFIFGSKKKNMWMRCRGADHSPGSMVGKEWDLVTLVGPFQMGISRDPKRDKETNTEPPHAITWPQ